MYRDLVHVLHNYNYVGVNGEKMTSNKLYPRGMQSTQRVVPKPDRDKVRNCPSEYMRVFFNFGYFLGYNPFRFAKLTNGSFVVMTSKTHQTICGIIHTLTLWRFLTAIREISVSEHDPSAYFELARNTATFIYMFTYMYIVWTKKALFFTLFNELQSLKNLEFDYPTKIRVKAMAIILCLIYTLVSALNLIVGHGIIRITDWNPHFLLRGHAGHGRYMLFLRSNATSVGVDELSVPNLFLAASHFVIHFYFKLAAHYTELLILFSALTLRHLAKGFALSLTKEQLNKTAKILGQYTALKKLAWKINMATGPVILCFVFEAMPYYSTHIGDVLSVTDWFVRFRYLFFIVNFSSIMIIAGDISHQVDAFRRWLNADENFSTISPSKLLVLINELSSYPIGLNARGLFTITYGFIGTLASIVITYAVIILQFKSSVAATNRQYGTINLSTEDSSP